MALTELKVKNAKLPEGKKQVKLTDGDGLYLLVNKHGKYWRLDYRYGGKRKTAALGVYPKVGIKDARRKRDEIRDKLEMGEDPARPRKTPKTTFEGVALEWLEKRKPELSIKHYKTVRARLDRYIIPFIGNVPIKDVDAPLLLDMLERIERTGHIELTHRVKFICGQICRYGIATGRASRDPTADLRGALTTRKSRHMPTILDPIKIGALMRAIGSYDGTFHVVCALRMAPYVFVRPGELRRAEWSEFDLDKKIWRIPAEKMKMKRLHLVPLSRQVMEILTKLQPITGYNRYLFPSFHSYKDRPISENTLNGALRRLGYSGDEIVVHGFRSMASTLLHEQGWPTDVIERQLAHVEMNEVKRAYNHAKHLEERTRMMQAWADYLDALAATD